MNGHAPNIECLMGCRTPFLIEQDCNGIQQRHANFRSSRAVHEEIPVLENADVRARSWYVIRERCIELA